MTSGASSRSSTSCCPRGSRLDRVAASFQKSAAAAAPVPAHHGRADEVWPGRGRRGAARPAARASGRTGGAAARQTGGRRAEPPATGSTGPGRAGPHVHQIRAVAEHASGHRAGGVCARIRAVAGPGQAGAVQADPRRDRIPARRQARRRLRRLRHRAARGRQYRPGPSRHDERGRFGGHQGPPARHRRNHPCRMRYSRRAYRNSQSYPF